jgi:hypothetical protein
MGFSFVRLIDLIIKKPEQFCPGFGRCSVSLGDIQRLTGGQDCAN